MTSNVIPAGEIWLNWEEISRMTNGKRTILFGRGEWMEKALNYLRDDVAFVVDNNAYEQGQQEHGLDIFSPQILREEDFDSIYVVITTSGFQDVEVQLREYGMVPGRHFCVSPSLRNSRVISRINRHRQTVYFTCSDRYLAAETEKGGGLYSLELATGTVVKMINGTCHGLVEGRDGLYLVDDEQGIRVLNRNFETEAAFALPPKSRPHGISYCPNRNAICVNLSGRDAIGVYDAADFRLIREISLSEKYARLGVPQHHVNDLCVFNNSLYVSMFSYSGNWKIGVYDGVILEIDIDSGRILGPVVTDLWMPHTPTMIRGALWYCDSMRGIVYNTTWSPITEFNGFVRGIAYDGEFYYIGQSMHRYIDRREGTTNNIALDTGVFMVDGASKATKFFALPQLTDINTVFVPSWVV